MAITVPKRAFGQKVSERVATPEINVRAATSVTDAMVGLGGANEKIAQHLMHKRKVADSERYNREADQDYRLNYQKEQERVMDTLDERGKNADGLGLKEVMSKWSEDKINSLMEFAPSRDAGRVFSNRVKGLETERLLKADVKEMEMEHKYSFDSRIDWNDTEVKNIESLKSGHHAAGIEHWSRIDEIVDKGTGLEYGMTTAEKLKEDMRSMTSNEVIKSAIRTGQYKDAISMLHGVLNDPKNAAVKKEIGLLGVSPDDLAYREKSILEDGLTPPEKNHYLNMLMKAMKTKKDDIKNDIKYRALTISETSKNNQLDLSDPKDRRAVSATQNLVLKHGKDFSAIELKDIAQKIYHDPMVGTFMKKNHDVPDSPQVRAALRKILEHANNKEARLIGRVRPGLQGFRFSGLGSASNVEEQVDAYMQKRREGNAVDFHARFDDKVAHNQRALNFTDPNTLKEQNGKAIIDQMKTYNNRSGNPLGEVIGDVSVKEISQTMRRLLSKEDNGEAMTDYVTAIKQNVGTENFTIVQDQISKTDPVVGNLMSVGIERYGKAIPPEIQRALVSMAGPDAQSAMKKGAESNDVTRSDIRTRVNGLSFWNPFVEDPEDMFKASRTHSSFGTEMRNHINRKLDRVNAIAYELVTNQNYGEGEAVEKAYAWEFQDTGFAEVEGSSLIFSKSHGYTKHDVEEMVDLTSRTSELPGLNSWEDVQFHFPDVAHHLKKFNPTDLRRGGGRTGTNTGAADDSYLFDIFKDNYGVIWRSTPKGFGIELNQKAGGSKYDPMLPKSLVFKTKQKVKDKFGNESQVSQEFFLPHEKVKSFVDLQKQQGWSKKDLFNWAYYGITNSVTSKGRKPQSVEEYTPLAVEEAQIMLQDMAERKDFLPKDSEDFKAVKDASKMLKKMMGKSYTKKDKEFTEVEEAQKLLKKMQRKDYLNNFYEFSSGDMNEPSDIDDGFFSGAE